MGFLAKFLNTDPNTIVCDQVEQMASIDADAYMGLWYEIAHSAGQGFQPDSWTCTTAEYTNLDHETGIFDVSNTS